MAYAVWNTAFEAKPQATDDPADGDDEFRDMKLLARQVIAKEHHLVPGSDAAVASQGWHLEGSAVAYYQGSAPTNRPDGSTSLDTDDGGRLWVDSDDGRLYVYTGSAWDPLTAGTTVNDALASLTAAEIGQLQNIGSNTITSTRWGYLGAMNQNVTTGSAVTFASVDTGNGAAELYTMDQPVRTTDDVVFASVDTGHGANDLYEMNQDVKTTDAVTFSSVGATALTASSSLSGVKTVKTSRHTDGPTSENSFYLTFSPHIPDGATVCAYGAARTPGLGGTVVILSSISRSGTTFTLYGHENSGSNVWSDTATSGNGSDLFDSISISI